MFETETDILRLLENRNLGTMGKDLGYGHTPATPNVMTVVKVYNGLTSEKRFGSKKVAYEYPRAQVLFRGNPEDLEPVLERAHKAHDVCAEVEAEALESDHFYHHVRPLGPPQFLRYDEMKRPEVVINLDIKKERPV